MAQSEYPCRLLGGYGGLLIMNIVTSTLFIHLLILRTIVIFVDIEKGSEIEEGVKTELLVVSLKRRLKL